MFKKNSLIYCAFLILAMTLSGIVYASRPNLNEPNDKVTDPTPGQPETDPVLISGGILIEDVVDLELPGVSQAWRHRRMYSSRKHGGTYIQGIGWKTEYIDSFVDTNFSSMTSHITPWHKSDYSWISSGLYYEKLRYEKVYAYLTDSGTKVEMTDADWVAMVDACWDVSGDTDPLIDFSSDPDGGGGDGKLFIPVDDLGYTINEAAVEAYHQACDWDFMYSYGRYCSAFADEPKGWIIVHDNPDDPYDPLDGCIDSITDRYRNEEITFSTIAGDLNRITRVTSNQGWSIHNSYNVTGYLTQIDVHNSSSQVIQRARYTYYESGQDYSSDAGTDDDLIMVEIFKRGTSDDLTQDSDSDFADCAVTMYRYYGEENADGSEHQMKMIIRADAVERLMADSSQTAAELLELDDDSIITTGVELQDYASLITTYYVETENETDFDTTDVDYDEGGICSDNEDLETKYGAVNLDETPADDLGFVRTQTVATDYVNNIAKYTFFYMALPNQDATPDEVSHITLYDREESYINGVRRGVREVHGVNMDGELLRTALIVNPHDASPEYYCESSIRGVSDTDGSGSPQDYGEVIQHRNRSAHTCIDTAAELVKFFDPCDGTNDSDTLNASDGKIYVAEYDDQGRMLYQGIANGANGLSKTSGEYTNVIWQTAWEYGDGSDDEPVSVLMATYTYPEATTSKTDASRVKCSYEYSFYDDDDLQCNQITLTNDAVSATENGSGVEPESMSWLDTRGRVRWRKDANGTVAYYSYNPDTGGLAYLVSDIDTSNMPSGVTSAETGCWVSWTENSGAAPTGYTSTSGLNKITKMYYDDQGRLVRSVDANSNVTCYAYNGTETRVYPGWTYNSGTSTGACSAPIKVTVKNDGGLNVEKYTLDPDGITIGTYTDGSDYYPNGSDTGVTQEDYITWSRYLYSDTTALIEQIIKYHDIPATGFGDVIENYNITFFKYDLWGRRTHKIQTVDGDSTSGYVEQVTEYVYDDLGRMISNKKAVSDASNVINGTGAYPGDYDNLSNLTTTTLREIYYDQATPGSGSSGVGDSKITQITMHGDASTSVDIVLYYDWRDRLRGIETPCAPYYVFDYDNKGRCIARGIFTSTSSFGTDWASVLADDDYAATASDTSREQAKLIYYATNDKVFRGRSYDVDANGDLDNYVQLDYFYDLNNRLVAISQPDHAAAEYAYDHLGRTIQVRAVKELAATPYSSGVFNYCFPQPVTDITASGTAQATDGGVIQLVHKNFDAVGNVISSYKLEINHDDTDGLDIYADDDYVMTSTHYWYNTVNKLIAQAQMGTCDQNDHWVYSSPTARTSSVPTSSTSGYEDALISTVSYSDGRLSTYTDPMGYEKGVVYDDLGRVIKTLEETTSSASRAKLVQYNGLSQAVKIIADIGNDATYSEGVWATTSLDEVTSRSFEDSIHADLITTVTMPDSSGSTDVVELDWAYDRNPLSRTSQDGTVIEYSYDSDLRRLTAQRVTSIALAIDDNVRSIGYGYDTLGRQNLVTSYGTTDCTGTPVNQVKYHYDEFGQVTHSYQSHSGLVDDDGLNSNDTPYVGYSYDTTASSNLLTNALRQTSITYPNGRQIDFDYGTTGGINDAFSRIIKVVENSDSTVLAEYGFNGLGRLVTEDFANGIALDMLGSTYSSTGNHEGFDRFGRIVQHQWNDSSTAVDKFLYTYNKNSNRTSREVDIAAATGLDELYGYDYANRLTSAERGTLSGASISSPTRSSDWSLDDLGNWSSYDLDANGDGDYLDSGDLAQSRSFNLANEISGISETSGSSWWDPGYDANGNMTSSGLPGDMESPYTFKYDAWNRLTEVGISGLVISQYRYDGLNRRIRTYELDSGYWRVNEMYYNTNWQMLEHHQSGDLTRASTSVEPSVATAIRYQYVWGRKYIDSPVCRDENKNLDDDCTDSSGDERIYYLSDGNFNVTALADSSGNIVECYSYDPYGAVTIHTPSFGSRGVSSYNNRILYCGYYLDKGTGLYHVRNRMYHPNLGHWLQRDPLGFVDGLNLYEYCGGRGIGSVDPSGLLEVIVWDEHGRNVGHAAIELEDGTYISWWPSGRGKGGNAKSGRFAAFMYDRPAFRNRTYNDDKRDERKDPDHRIQIDGLDEDAIKKFWEDEFLNNPDQVWEGHDQNCAETVAECLQEGGAPWEWEALWVPADVVRYADDIVDAINDAKKKKKKAEEAAREKKKKAEQAAREKQKNSGQKKSG